MICMVLNLLSILDHILFVRKSILCLLILLNALKMLRHIFKILIKNNLFRSNVVFRRQCFRYIWLLTSFQHFLFRVIILGSVRIKSEHGQRSAHELFAGCLEKAHFVQLNDALVLTTKRPVICSEAQMVLYATHCLEQLVVRFFWSDVWKWDLDLTHIDLVFFSRLLHFVATHWKLVIAGPHHHVALEGLAAAVHGRVQLTRDSCLWINVHYLWVVP